MRVVAGYLLVTSVSGGPNATADGRKNNHTTVTFMLLLGLLRDVCDQHIPAVVGVVHRWLLFVSRKITSHCIYLLAGKLPPTV